MICYQNRPIRSCHEGSPALQASLQPCVRIHWVPSWNLWGQRASDAHCFPRKSWKNIFSLTILIMLKQNIHQRRWKNRFQSASTPLSQTNRDKELKRQDGSNLMVNDYKGPKPGVTVTTTPGQGDHSVGMWSVNNFRIRHQNICTDASQLPITAACTTQLPKALWYALMNKHLWLIGKCISRVACCSPT